MPEESVSTITERKLQVIIADDQLIARLGLRLLIEHEFDMEVVLEAENGLVAFEAAQRLRPAVVIMDVIMPVMDGIEATRQIKQELSSVRVLMLTNQDRDDDVFAALAAGADGYCLKDTSPEGLANAIRAVNQGAAWLDPSIAKKVLSIVNSRTPAPSIKTSKFNLSARELEILELLVDGLSNQQMADRMYISLDTVKTHMKHIMEKLLVSDRTQAAVKALRDGLVSRD